MDIELLRTFLAVRDSRHFGKAAQSLNITQAAVSIRIKQLENMLDAPLFVRFRNNLQLTETGERLVPYAEDILLSWGKARENISLRKNGRKPMRFGAVNGFCGILLKDALSAIYNKVTNIMLNVASHDEETLLSRLQDKRVDLGLLYDPSRYTGYKSVPVSSVELVHVTTEKQPGGTGVGDYVAVEWGSFYNNRLINLATSMPEPVLKASQSSFALQFLLDRGGNAFLPYRLVKEYLDKGLFMVAGSEVIHQPIYAVYHEASSLGQEIGQVVDVIREHARPLTSSLEEVMAAFGNGFQEKSGKLALAAAK